MSTPEKALKSEKFDLRMSEEEQRLIREAAKLRRTSPTGFIREQAVIAAEAILHEQQRFVLTAEQWRRVNETFDRPAKVLPNLRTILAAADQWDEE